MMRPQTPKIALMGVWRFFLPDLIFLTVVVAFLCVGLLFSLPARRSTGQPSAMASLAPVASLPSPLLDAAANTITSTYQQETQWLNQPKGMLLFTDPALTTNNPAVISLWGVVLFISDSTLGIFLVLAGYRVMLGGFGSGYANALEELPRLISSLIGANISLIFATFWIILNNLLCGVMSAQVNYQPVPVFQLASLLGSLNLIALLLLFILVILLAFLGIQAITRLALLLVLTVCLPALFLLLANIHTRQFGQAGLQAYVTTVLVQVLQITCLTVATKVVVPLVATIGQSADFASIVLLLASIAVFWLTLRIPAMLRQWALQPIAAASGAARTIVVASVARLLFF